MSAARPVSTTMYSTRRHTWQVWRSGKCLTEGSLEHCRTTHPEALPPSDHQRARARVDHQCRSARA